MEIRKAIAVLLYGGLDPLGQVPIGVHVEEDGPRRTNQSPGPYGNDDRADHAGERIGPRPAKDPGENEAGDDQHRDGGVGQHVHHGSAHVVVLVDGMTMRFVMVVLLENGRAAIRADEKMHRESMGLGDRADALKVVVQRLERVGLAGAVRPLDLGHYLARGGKTPVSGPQTEHGRVLILEDLQREDVVADGDTLLVATIRTIMTAMIVPVRSIVPAAMRVSVIMSAAEKPRAGGVDGQTQHGGRQRLGERDRHRIQKTRDRLVGDEKSDERQYDGAGEAREIAELAGAEGEATVLRVMAGEGIGQRCEKKGTGVGAHVEPVGDERDRTEEETAHDLDHHHRAAKRDDRPSLPFGLLVPLAEEHVIVREV